MIGGENLTAIAMDAALLMIVAIGQMLVMLTRNIDLSVASIIGLSAYGAASFMHNHPASPVLMGVGVASLIGLGCGLLNGSVVTLGGVPSIVVTLGSLAVFRGVVSLWAGGRQISADQVPQSWLDMTGARILGVPAVVLIALAALVAIGAILHRHCQIKEFGVAKRLNGSDADCQRPYVPPPSLPAGSHQLCRLAVFPVSAEPPHGRRTARGARDLREL
jgi:ribose/xylose/arabinose/galactoside ABC-type transport system permease subunit